MAFAESALRLAKNSYSNGVDEEENGAAATLQTLASEDTEVLFSTGILLLLLMICFSLVVMHFLYKHSIVFVQLPICATLIGLLGGILAKYAFGLQKHLFTQVLTLNDNIFFIFLLPPIIFEAGLSITDSSLGPSCLANFSLILYFAIFCTLVSFAFVGSAMFLLGSLGVATSFTLAQSFAFGALISSTDPVSIVGMFKSKTPNNVVHAIVAGESVLNDAIVLVLYRTIALNGFDLITELFGSFLVNFFISFLIGIGIGLLTAIIYKWVEFPARENVIYEITLSILLPWCAYCLAEAYSYSGIVSICFCGIVMGKYSFKNFSESSRKIARAIFSVISLLAETVVFLLMGLAVTSVSHREVTLSLYVSSFIIITLARWLSVCLTCYLINWKTKILPIQFQYALIFCGLKGAVAFALSQRATGDFAPVGNALLSVTLFYSLFTILLIGPFLYVILKYLKIFDLEHAQDTHTIHTAHRIVHIAPSNSKVNGTNALKKWLLRFDERVMQPFFTSYVASGVNDSLMEPTALRPNATVKANKLTARRGNLNLSVNTTEIQ